jgi:hypothetical protein
MVSSGFRILNAIKTLSSTHQNNIMQLGEDVIHLLIQKPVEFLLLQITSSMIAIA